MSKQEAVNLPIATGALYSSLLHRAQMSSRRAGATLKLVDALRQLHSQFSDATQAVALLNEDSQRRESLIDLSMRLEVSCTCTAIIHRGPHKTDELMHADAVAAAACVSTERRR